MGSQGSSCLPKAAGERPLSTSVLAYQGNDARLPVRRTAGRESSSRNVPATRHGETVT